MIGFHIYEEAVEAHFAGRTPGPVSLGAGHVGRRSLRFSGRKDDRHRGHGNERQVHDRQPHRPDFGGSGGAGRFDDDREFQGGRTRVAQRHQDDHVGAFPPAGPFSADGAGRLPLRRRRDVFRRRQAIASCGHQLRRGGLYEPDAGTPRIARRFRKLQARQGAAVPPSDGATAEDFGRSAGREDGGRQSGRSARRIFFWFSRGTENRFFRRGGRAGRAGGPGGGGNADGDGRRDQSR